MTMTGIFPITDEVRTKPPLDLPYFMDTWRKEVQMVHDESSLYVKHGAEENLADVMTKIFQAIPNSLNPQKSRITLSKEYQDMLNQPYTEARANQAADISSNYAYLGFLELIRGNRNIARGYMRTALEMAVEGWTPTKHDNIQKILDNLESTQKILKAAKDDLNETITQKYGGRTLEESIKNSF